MTLIKSLLLGSAAGLVAVSAAQAADLPTRKGPVAAEYVRVCSITVAGVPVVGYVLPGSDTCFKISGYITGQVEGGNVYTGYTNNYKDGDPTLAVASKYIAPGAYNGVAGKQVIPSNFHPGNPTLPGGGVPAFIARNDMSGNFINFADGTAASTARNPVTLAPVFHTFNNVHSGQLYWKQDTYAGQQKIASSPSARDSFGFTTRFNLTFDAVSNTAYGPLVAHGEYQFNHGEGFDNTGQGGSDGGLNRAYVTWAGLTAGKIDSFFSFTGGGLAWANFFSPDRKGFNQPDVLAYTASFGGGFAATLSLESTGGVGTSTPVPNTATSGGSEVGYLGSATQNGHRVPDIVGALSVHQAWGSAQVSGVAHNVRAASSMGDKTNLDKWGFAVDAGVQFNIPNMAGSFIGVTGAWSQNATWYSGLPDGMWGENGAVNGNGQAMPLGDAFANGDGTWATPQAWSVTAYAQFQVNPQVTLGLEGSYGQIHWSGNHAIGVAALPNIGVFPVTPSGSLGGVAFNPGGSVLSDSESWLIGGIAHYDPVKNLDFEFELLYQATHTKKPAGYIAGDGVNTTATWHGVSDGFAARFEVTRSF